MKSRVGRFPPQPPLEGRRDRDARSEIRAVLLGTLKGGGGRVEGGHDDVDGGLKGNERGMMQAWVRGSRRRQGMVSADRREPEGKKKRKKRGDVPRVYAISDGERLFGAWAQRFVDTALSLPFRMLPARCATRANAADDYALASPSPDN